MRQLARATRKDVSTLLLGNRHKLTVVTALALAKNGRVNLTDLATSHGLAASVYYQPTKDLMALGLVRQVEAVPGQRRRWYERCGDTRVWRGLRALARALEDYSPPEVASDDPG